MTEPFVRGSLPSAASLTQSANCVSSVRARVMVTVPDLARPTILLSTYLPSAVCVLTSIMSNSCFRPEISMIPLAWCWSNSKPNDAPMMASNLSIRPTGRYLRLGWGGRDSLADQADAALQLCELEDDELGRLHRRHADLAGDLAQVDGLGRVGLVVALDEERLGGRRAEQGALAPLHHQERGDRAPDLGPQVAVVVLEHHPVGVVEDRLLQIVEQPAHVHVTPGRVAGQRPRPPHPHAAARERPQAVDALGVQQVVLVAGDRALQRDGASHDLVGRGLVHAALVVVAGPDAGHVARRRDEDALPAGGVEHLDARPVQGGELGVVPGALDPPQI